MEVSFRIQCWAQVWGHKSHPETDNVQISAREILGQEERIYFYGLHVVGWEEVRVEKGR